MARGELRLVVRHLLNHGRSSEIPALGNECAGEQGAFWEFHDARFQSGSPNVDGQISLARTLGLDVPRFTACMQDQRYQKSLSEDRRIAQEYGVRVQPTFVISSGDQRSIQIGFRNFEQLSAIIDDYLN